MIAPIRQTHLFLSVLIVATAFATTMAYTAEPPQSGTDHVL